MSMLTAPSELYLAGPNSFERGWDWKGGEGEGSGGEGCWNVKELL